MQASQPEPDLVQLRKMATAMAASRKESMTTGHLLAALANVPSPAQRLLLERNLGIETLLKAARTTTDEEPDPLNRAFERARQLAQNMHVKATALHLLIALVQDRRMGAYRALEQCGVEVSRLRVAARQVANIREGVSSPRASRQEPAQQRSSAAQAQSPAQVLMAGRPSRSSDRGTTVSLLDLPRRSSTTLPEGARPCAAERHQPSPSASSASVSNKTSRRSHDHPRSQTSRSATPSTPTRNAPSAGPSAGCLSGASSQPVLTPALASPMAAATPPMAAATPPMAAATQPMAAATPAMAAATPAMAAATPLMAAAAPPTALGGLARPILVRPGCQEPSDGRFLLDPKRFPLLSAVGKNLSLSAARGELEPVLGRDQEIEQALDVLAKRQGNNPILVGGPGVGKTSVARGIALRMASLASVGTLDDRILVEVPISELLAGSAARGALAERIGLLRSEVKSARGRIVIFFDEIHGLFGNDADEASSELKSALSRGELPCVGTSTAEDYRRTIELDGGLARRFTVVPIEEPNRAAALEIVRGSVQGLSGHHGIAYADPAVDRAVEWSIRYVTGRMLPDKALSILDLAGARARRRSAAQVGPECVAEVVSELTEVPVDRLLETDQQRMLGLEALLARRVVGHAAALARMAAILKRNAAGFRGQRPIGTFLLLGPTGVGKTESAKAVAEALFHSADAMTRLDMAEFAESHAVARLVGSPPGYVGHDAGGQLTEAVRRRPYQVILLDEIEKAHRDVLEAFLSVFDEGRLTDGRGRTVDFANTVILMTSNLGAEKMSAKVSRGIGFASREGGDIVNVEESLLASARAALPPELYNRIDEVIAFAPLRKTEVAEIARRLLAGIGTKLVSAQGIHLDVDEEAIDALLSAGGFDPELGARPMKRTLARLVEAPIAEMILKGDLSRGDVARLTTSDDAQAAGGLVLDVVRGGQNRARAS